MVTTRIVSRRAPVALLAALLLMVAACGGGSGKSASERSSSKKTTTTTAKSSAKSSTSTTAKAGSVVASSNGGTTTTRPTTGPGAQIESCTIVTVDQVNFVLQGAMKVTTATGGTTGTCSWHFSTPQRGEIALALTTASNYGALQGAHPPDAALQPLSGVGDEAWIAVPKDPATTGDSSYAVVTARVGSKAFSLNFKNRWPQGKGAPKPDPRADADYARRVATDLSKTLAAKLK